MQYWQPMGLYETIKKEQEQDMEELNMIQKRGERNMIDSNCCSAVSASDYVVDTDTMSFTGTIDLTQSQIDELLGRNMDPLHQNVEEKKKTTKKIPIEEIPAGLIPSKVWRTHQGRTMTVEFRDGEKITVDAADGQDPDYFVQFCIAIAKRVLGGTSAIDRRYKMAWEKAYEKSIQRKMLNFNKKHLIRALAEKKKRAEEFAIQDRMHQLYIEREAKRRIEEADKNKENEQ